MQNAKTGALVVTLLVVVHLIVSTLHVSAHTDLSIVLSFAQTSFINVVILLMPILGAGLAWTANPRVGFFLVLVGMVGALIFGIYYHYVGVSTDHISHLPDGPAHVHDRFIWTAAAIAVLEGVTASAAAYYFGRANESV